MTQKFAFSTVFSESGEVLRDGDRVRRILTEEEVAEAKKIAFSEGESSQVARAAQTEADAMRAIASQMQLILTRLHGESETLRADAAKLAIAASSKIAGAALDNFAADTVAALAAEAMGELRGEPRLSVHCAPELEAPLSDKLAEVAQRSGFEGAVTVRGEAGLTGADCRLEWRRGSISRSHEEIAERLDALVMKWLERGPEESTATDDVSSSDGEADTHAA
ncbi:hypothetical protein L5876_12915 [Hyphobacterium sp. SN044]|uniref:FliH/SctL family protein n=1 Tax=Hyphobacterium sp. SN044 TaxID=2912575 RepID=UPI001F301127|nr:FliH/SctL family protein [Hyphobacterium sp. SN044]MCF8880721.1 hypothetical protein [Hyphobacterium sp. SN044]